MKKIIGVALATVLALMCFACVNKKGDGSATTLEDLKGQVVYNMPGQGQVTDLVFRYILKQNNIDYQIDEVAHAGKVLLAYAKEADSVVSQIVVGNKSGFGIVAEPSTGAALQKNTSLRLMLDIQQLYQTASGAQTAGWPQAVLVVKTEFLQANPAYVSAFVSAFQTGGEWLLNNAEDGLKAVTDASPQAPAATLSRESIERSRIGFVPSKNLKADFLTFVNGINGTLTDEETPTPMPDDAFFADVPQVTGDTALSRTAQIYVPQGAPAFALAQLLHSGLQNTKINVVTAPELPTAVLQKADIAVMPSTAAAALYKKSNGKIRMLGQATGGNMYLLKRV